MRHACASCKNHVLEFLSRVGREGKTWLTRARITQSLSAVRLFDYTEVVVHPSGMLQHVGWRDQWVLLTYYLG